MKTSIFYGSEAGGDGQSIKLDSPYRNTFRVTGYEILDDQAFSVRAEPCLSDRDWSELDRFIVRLEREPASYPHKAEFHVSAIDETGRQVEVVVGLWAIGE